MTDQGYDRLTIGAGIAVIFLVSAFVVLYGSKTDAVDRLMEEREYPYADELVAVNQTTWISGNINSRTYTLFLADGSTQEYDFSYVKQPHGGELGGIRTFTLLRQLNTTELRSTGLYTRTGVMR